MNAHPPSQRRRELLAALVAAPVLAWLAPSARAENNLFKELGGIRRIERITTALLDRVYADERIAFLFEGTDRDYLHNRIVEQICMETGGPCEYQGLSMKRAHGGLAIRQNEFDAFVEDFILAMEDAGVSYRLQNRVLKIFAPMRGDIVYR